MKSLRIEVFETNEMVTETIEIINDLKNQYWKHTKEEHMKWFKDNIKSDDEHLLIWGHNLLAYLNLIHVDVEIDKRPYRMFGIGNVCVSKERKHAGIGTILMATVNAFLKEKKSCGLLLCHENMLKFYESCGWIKMNATTVTIEKNSYEYCVMFKAPCYMLPNNAEHIWINRSF